ncbi:EF-P 5-aminopentanol modification-associated protein YfmH [Salsuginibacillus kocurii]|uniref:EF-P 5-aminopentanol modification-associated protein YfmH n=1 Tax=Salsuginibacillus kocurii TaxID=427078 RepID=UPI00035EF051|nr:pitrilysin family protein [Salsuginibacillus kocurii]
MLEKKDFPTLKETLYQEKLDNGLSVFLLPKDSLNKTFATFTTNYGSVDDHFVPLKGEEAVKVPDGIAHFLEHKMFEDEEGDVFQTFGERGAQANAFTTFTRTAYLFSSTEQVIKNVHTLLDFVQHPYFTEDSVEKEKGIIEQEIRMYKDNADFQILFGLLSEMYQKHPVATDIAGTEESIQEITKDDLYTCYNTFYHPVNMTLFIVGPFDPEKMIEEIRNNQAEKSFDPPEEIERIFPDEPAEPKSQEKQTEMSVSTPKCLMGFKDKNPNRQGEELLRYELSIQLALDAMFGPGSEAYEEMYEEGLIDDSFSVDFTAEKTFAFSLIGGDSKDPEELVARIEKVLSSFRNNEISDELFQRVRKKRIGTFLKQLNSPEFIATQFTRYEENGMDLFDVVPTLEDLTHTDVNKALNEHFEPTQQSVHYIKPKVKVDA